MSSLWDLAQIEKQPDLQYLDTETLNEISKRRPIFDSTDKIYSLTTDDEKLIRFFAPPIDWYLDRRIYKTIHGLSHALRVMIYALILGKERSLNSNSTDALLLASSVHDVRRLDDKGDNGHEERVVKWLENELPKISKINKATISLATKILEDDSVLMGTLRIADALDRYRLPKVKWWINDKFLEDAPPDSLKSFAFNLILKSETKILDGINPLEAVIA